MCPNSTVADPNFRLVFESHTGRALVPIREEKHEPVSDIDTVVVDSLKALDPKRPIREADMIRKRLKVRFWTQPGHRSRPTALCRKPLPAPFPSTKLSRSAA